MKTRMLAFACIFALLLACSPRVNAIEDGSPEAVAADVLVVRPLCLAMTVLGSALFVELG
jgi:hypothetical protein